MPLIVKYGKWHYRFKVRGREYSRSTGLDAARSNRSAAEKIEAQAKLEALAEVEREPAPVPEHFHVAAADFIHWCKHAEYRGKPKTARRIEISFASIVAFFGDALVSEIEPAHIEDYKVWRIETHGVRDITLRHDLHALSLFFRKYAIKRGLAAGNPTAFVTKPSDRDAVRIHVLTPEEEDAYFAHARGTIYDVARLILLQGCRPEEIMTLRWDDVNLTDGTIYIRGGKTRASQRLLDLTSEALAILARRREKYVESPWVFPSSRLKGGHLTKLNAQHDRVCLDAGVSFVLYDLRHTFATRMACDAHVDLPTLAAILGHSGLKMVMRYVHPTQGAKRQAMKDYERLLQPRLRRVK